MVGEDRHGFRDQVDSYRRGSGISVDKKVRHALEVVECARRIDQPRHGLACGLAALRSVTRALSQSCTSAAS